MKRSPWATVAVYLLALLAVVVFMFPVVWLLLTSIKPSELTFAYPPVLTFEPTLESYQEVLGQSDFPRYLLNSIIVGTLATGVALALALPAGYALARMRTRGRGALRAAALLPQMLPVIVVVIPIYMIFRSTGLLDNVFSLAFTYLALTVPISVWILSRFIEDLPVELDEAAVVDGASRWQILRLVVLPLVRPGPGRGRRPLPPLHVERVPLRAHPHGARRQDRTRGHRRLHDQQGDLLGAHGGGGDHRARAGAGLRDPGAPPPRARSREWLRQVALRVRRGGLALRRQHPQARPRMPPPRARAGGARPWRPTTRSARHPGSSRPRSSRPSRRAGFCVAARRATASGMPWRTAPATMPSSSSRLPASVPSGCTARPPSTRAEEPGVGTLRSRLPARGRASETSTSRSSPMARAIGARRPGSTWMPSVMSSTKGAAASAAPTGPGSRARSGGMPLKRCVVERAPAA